MPDRNLVPPLGGRPNDFLGIGSDETERDGVWRLNECRAAKKTAAIAARTAAIPAVIGCLIAGAAVIIAVANDGERIEGHGRRCGLDQTEAADERLQCEHIGSDPSDRRPQSGVFASAHDNPPADSYVVTPLL
jgi:hypothetical protein